MDVPQKMTETIGLVIKANELVREFQPLVNVMQRSELQVQELDNAITTNEKSIQRVGHLLSEKQQIQKVAGKLLECFNCFALFDEAMKQGELTNILSLYRQMYNAVNDLVGPSTERKNKYIVEQLQEELSSRKKKFSSFLESTVRHIFHIEQRNCSVKTKKPGHYQHLLESMELCGLLTTSMQTLGRTYYNYIISFLVTGQYKSNVEPHSDGSAFKCLETESKELKTSEVLREIEAAISYILGFQFLSGNALLEFGNTCWTLCCKGIEEHMATSLSQSSISYRGHQETLNLLTTYEESLKEQGIIPETSLLWKKKGADVFQSYLRLRRHHAFTETRDLVLRYDFRLQQQESSFRAKLSPDANSFIESLPTLPFNPFIQDGATVKHFSKSPFEMCKFNVSVSANRFMKIFQDIIQEALGDFTPMHSKEILLLAKDIVVLYKTLVESHSNKIVQSNPKDALVMFLDCSFISHNVTLVSVTQLSRHVDFLDVCFPLSKVGKNIFESVVTTTLKSAMGRLMLKHPTGKSSLGSTSYEIEKDKDSFIYSVDDICTACVEWKSVLPDYLWQAVCKYFINSICNYIVAHILEQKSIVDTESHQWNKILLNFIELFQIRLNGKDSHALVLDEIRGFQRINAIAKMMKYSLQQFSTLFKPGSNCPFSKSEVSKLVVSLFKASEKREQVLKELREISMETL